MSAQRRIKQAGALTLTNGGTAPRFLAGDAVAFVITRTSSSDSSFLCRLRSRASATIAWLVAASMLAVGPLLSRLPPLPFAPLPPAAALSIAGLDPPQTAPNVVVPLENGGPGRPRRASDVCAPPAALRWFAPNKDELLLCASDGDVSACFGGDGTLVRARDFARVCS